MKNRSILHIDGNSLILKTIENELKKSNLDCKLKTASTCEDGLEIIEKDKPSIVILGLNFYKSEMHGFECLKRIMQIDKTIKVIMLTCNSSKYIIKEALKLGADGYVLKGTSINEIINAIEIVEKGRLFIYDEVFLDIEKKYTNINIDKKILSNSELKVLELLSLGYNTKEIADKLSRSKFTIAAHRRSIIEKLKNKKKDKRNIFKQILSPFELEILELLILGYSFKEIAEKLFRSAPGINSHRLSIIRKLKAKNIIHAVVIAIQLGLIDPNKTKD